MNFFEDDIVSIFSEGKVNSSLPEDLLFAFSDITFSSKLLDDTLLLLSKSE